MSTATLEQTVGELVTKRPARAKVFETFGIDYCCGGKKPLKEACNAKGIDPDMVLQLLNLLDEQNGEVERDWSTATMTELCDHIEQTHHAYLKRDLPRMEFLVTKVAARHSEQAHLAEIRDTFLGLQAELMSHMMKEERVLFPICRAMEQGNAAAVSHCGTVENPIRQMIHEHDDAGDALARIRELTQNYVPPAEACNTYRAMYDALRELEQDMHRHVHKENSILFPKAAEVERKLRGA
jgi:regulator of cell morphogenesis and NO signaling